MDSGLIKCCRSRSGQTTKYFGLRRCCSDRLTSLPNEVICGILSLLPTKDAVVACLSSRKMMAPFSTLTTLDIDDSPISYCASKHPYLIHRFQYFKTFVDNVLQPSQSPSLVRFRLSFGGDRSIKSHHESHRPILCGVTCFPDLESPQLNAWIAFPLSRFVREIDLCIHVRNPGKLPITLFTCQTLEVLKLDTNLELDFQLLFSIPSFRLPNLKVLHLRSVLIPEDSFFGRLISMFPLLEELDVSCWWKCGNSITISSPSLQKLSIYTNKDCEYCHFFSMDTPNLRYLQHGDILALRYSVKSMNVIVEALFDIWNTLPGDEESFHNMLSLIRAVPNAQRLSLTLSCVEALDWENRLQDQLPIFHNLTYLELGSCCSHKWNIVLLEFLKCSPVLETLEFPNGLASFGHEDIEFMEIERQFFRTNQVNLSCCKSHLKKVIMKECWGLEREIEALRFLLKNALVLEELMVICSRTVDRPTLKRTLSNLPRASSTCLIIVQ